MMMVIKSNEISKVAKILATNNFVNVKDVNRLAKYLHFSIANYYILSVQKHFASCLIYDKYLDDATNYFEILVSDYNMLFNEAIKIKKEDIRISIIDGGQDDK